ncbi:hypothetical protein TASIC1_0001063800 [Trichoderma asperellum]|uniref:Uncharacterized protein n=1 Tax=Trichoderma asperellum TaxID=101201 RepID=A0A6V8QL39_TRIAP|nr:hypothetical protein LI328DRAFT_160160 [Trichoderma asperelloides]GFP52486.1 hypothetical protein TASIC1_0001063800 [Trichoderma asperellum]
MGVPPPSSSLSSLSSSSLAAANDTRDAIALSRRASSRPSKLGIALVFPALIQYGAGAGSTLLEREARPRTPASTSTLTPSAQGLVSVPCAGILPQSHHGPGAHRPTATRRLPSRRTPTLDAGATAAAASLCIHGQPGGIRKRSVIDCNPFQALGHAQPGWARAPGCLVLGQGCGWLLLQVALACAPAQKPGPVLRALWAPKSAPSCGPPSEPAADAPPVAACADAAAPFARPGGQGYRCSKPLLSAPWSRLDQGDALTSTVYGACTSYRHGCRGTKTATAMRGGSTTPLPSFQMHIKGLSSEYLYLPPPLQICPGSCPSVFLSAFAVNARSP